MKHLAAILSVDQHSWLGSREYDKHIDEHRAIWNLEEGKYTTRFIPESVVFADGSKLEVPELEMLDIKVPE